MLFRSSGVYLRGCATFGGFSQHAPGRREAQKSRPRAWRWPAKLLLRWRPGKAETMPFPVLQGYCRRMMPWSRSCCVAEERGHQTNRNLGCETCPGERIWHSLVVHKLGPSERDRLPLD